MIIGNLRVLNWFWFSHTKGIIGIIACLDVITKQKKAYIGIGNNRNEEEDIKHIVEMGAKLPIEIVNSIKLELTNE